MADVLALLAGAVIVIAGIVAASAIARARRHAAIRERREAPFRLERELAAAERRLQQINDAQTAQDLDRLDNPERGS
jgi:hypothetical protein